MKYKIIPYGTDGWNEKIRIVNRIIASRQQAPFIYNDVLILVPSARMKRMYGRLLLDALQQLHGAAALIQPEVRTLHQFFDHLYAQAQGPRVMDENSRLILLEGIVKQRLAGDVFFSRKPDLLAPSLSSALAKMIEQLSAAGVGPDDLSRKISEAEFFDKPQVRLLIDVYTRYRNELRKRTLTDPAGRNAYLAKEFSDAWLSRYREIIIDGIHDADPLETDILRNIAACKDCTWLVEAPSSELLNHPQAYHPLSITKAFLTALAAAPAPQESAVEPPPASRLSRLRGLVGTKTERDLPRLTAFFPRQESGDSMSQGLNSDNRFLATALFSDKPFADILRSAPTPSSFAKRINILSAVNTREEASLIAGMIKTSVKSGTPPESILVAFPALDEYGPLVEEIFTDYGIPYNRALGRQLSASPVVMSLVSLLRACQEDFSGPSLLRVFSSPFLKFAEYPALAPALDRFLREKRIIGGKEKLLAALRRSASPPPDLAVPLQDLFTALEPFSLQATAPLSVWMERLNTLLAWSGLTARVAAVHGALNINLQAFRKLNETLVSLTRAGMLFPEYTYTVHEWLFLVKKTFMHTRFQVPPEDEGGVQILGLEETTGRPWEEIYLGGLTDTAFPQRLPQNIFLPETTLERLDIRTLERARLNAAYHFYRLLLSADRVTLTYPENEGDRPMAPSPFLEELTPLAKTGLLNRGIEKTSGIQFSLNIEESRSIPELAKAISRSAPFSGIRPVFESGMDGLSGIRSAVQGRAQDSARSASSGPVIPFAKQAFWVTELDDYLNCPYDYYVKHVLGIERLEDVSEDISALDRGSKIHSLLRNFYLSWNASVTRENREEARALLKSLADAAFDEEADTIRNRREKDRFLDVMAERFLDAEEVFWKQGMRPAYLEQKIGAFELTLANGGRVELSAKIDRIDADQNGNFIIVDYKTGGYPQPKMGLEQEIFQLPVYAVMASSALIGKGPALKKPIGLAYYDLAGKTGAGARDVVLYNKDSADEQPASKPKASPKNAEEFETILKQSMDKAREAVEGILAGDFISRPQDKNKCRYCPNEMLCGNNHDR